jgi:hypothetical protein
LNFAGLATKLAAAWQKAPSKLQNFWESAGGQINALKKAWEAGSKKKRIFGDGIGVAPAAPAAAAATAAPLLIKVADFLKKIGIEPDELVQVGRDALNKRAQELAKKTLEPKAASEAVNIDIADQVFEPAELQATTDMAPATTTVTKKPNFLPLLIGGAAVLYFVTRRK